VRGMRDPSQPEFAIETLESGGNVVRTQNPLGFEMDSPSKIFWNK